MTKNAPPDARRWTRAALTVAYLGMGCGAAAIICAWLYQALAAYLLIGLALLAVLVSAALAAEFHRRQKRHYGL